MWRINFAELRRFLLKFDKKSGDLRFSSKRKIQAKKPNLQLSIRFTKMIGFDIIVY